MHAALQTLYQAILDGDVDAAAVKVQAALDAQLAPGDILRQGLVAAMSEAGRLFETGDCFVPEMYMSATAMQAGLAVLKPHLVAAGVAPVGTVVIGTVQGDLHEIGKNLVAMLLEGAGFQVIDLGVDVAPDAFIAAIQAHHPQVVALSTLLTTTMPKMEDTITAMQAAGVRDRVKVMVGGAPITTDFAESIGADGYAADASKAVALAKTYLA